jgi:hypothetical protein
MTANKPALTFDVALKRYTQYSKLTMHYARVCADMAIDQFEQHGNLVQAQRLHDAIPANYGRRAAFVKWLCDFSPAAYKAGKFTKDKSDNAKPFQVVEAKAIAYWEHTPDNTQVTEFKADELIKALNAVINKFGGEKSRPKDDIALRTLQNAKRVVASLMVPSNVVVLPAPAQATVEPIEFFEEPKAVAPVVPVTAPAVIEVPAPAVTSER